jgi:acetate kinase
MVRRALCERLGILGIALDAEANEAPQTAARSIHSPQSSVELWVIPTDEEGVIAEESYAFIGREK